MRVLLSVLGLAAMAACAPAVPDSAEGVGIGDYQTYLTERQARERALMESRQTVRPPQQETAAAKPPTPTPTVATPTQQPPRATAATPVAKPRSPAPAQSRPASTPAGANNPGISDEQDFSAVSSRETIESDRERLKQQRAQYQQFEPEALPARNSGGRPNIVEYALGSTNVPGQAVYRRSGFRSAASNERNCTKYGSADIAQEAFLANGGPTKDRENLDPDGDGFACGWDPRPFRNAVKR